MVISIFPICAPFRPVCMAGTSLPFSFKYILGSFISVCVCPPSSKSIPDVEAITSSSLMPCISMPKWDKHTTKLHFSFFVANFT
mgnify:CR=1 FL=1